FERHVFCRCALPLHYGRRNVAGVSRRAALLVAENQRAHVPRRLGKIFRADCFRWIQSDVLATVPAGLHGHAAPLSHVSGRDGVMASAARAVDCGCVDPWGRADDPIDLSRLVTTLWADRGSEPMASTGTRVADCFAAAYREF